MKILQTTDLLSSGQALTDRLTTSLQTNSRVIWLVPGGSNIALATAIMTAIPAKLTNNLTLMLTDERYGDWDHPDSNFRQLREAGFDAKQARFLPTLSPDNLSLEDTVLAYPSTVAKEFPEADDIIGHFGMGADGHIAGILPQSPATFSDQLVAGYSTASFTRITLTFHALRRLQSAYVFAFGDEKREAIAHLQTDLALVEQPAQIIKSIPDSYVYNDQMGDTV